MRKALLRLEPLSMLIENENYDKLQSILEGGAPSASPSPPPKVDLDETKESVYMRKTSFENLNMANE